MKRTVIWVLVLSMILSLIPGVPLVTQATSDDPNYARRVTVRWGETGEHLWEVVFDHEQQLERLNAEQDLPEGVCYETGKLTLSGAELFSIELDGWGTIPFRLEVLGENTIAAQGMNVCALNIRHCHDMTIDGGGMLTMTSEFATLQVYDTVAGTWSQEGGETVFENGLLTIRDVTLDIRNLRAADGFNEFDFWQWSALDCTGNVAMQNAVLNFDGQGGLNIAGNLTIDGCTIDATGFSYSCREVQVNDGQAEDGFYPSSGIITDSTLNIRDFRIQTEWVYHTMVIQPAAELTLGEGARVELEHSCDDCNITALVVNSDWQGTGKPGSLRVDGGSLTIHSDDAHYAALALQDGATLTQTGGEILVETALLEVSGIALSRDALWLQTGGTLRITNSNESVDTGSLLQPAAMEFYQGSRGIFSGGTLTASGDLVQAMRINGEVLFSGTELTLDAHSTGLDLYPRANVTLLDGRVDFTARDRENTIGIVAINGAGFTMIGGTLDLNAQFGLYASNGSFRFLGGETRIRGDFATFGGEPRFTFGEGIAIAYDDGTEALWQDGWLIPISEPVTIKSQVVRAPECILLPELVYPNSVVMGVPTPVELVAALTSPTGTIRVALPAFAKLDESGVWVNGREAEYRTTQEGFELEVPNGSYITFQLLHGSSGEKTLTARAENREFPVTYECSGYSFNVAPVTLTDTIILKGTALPGATVVIHEASGGELLTVQTNELGTWRTVLHLAQTGDYYFYVMLYDAEGNYITVSQVERVQYSDSETVLESLTVGNWIHGPTDESPHEYTEVTFDYVDLSTSSSYYTYWPELPEFTFTARFSGKGGTPAYIKEVTVIATDDRNVSKAVPLTYDAERGLWTGKAEFCCDSSIIPNRFQVQWKDANGSVGTGEEEYVDPRPRIDQDNTSGAVLVLPAGEAGPFALDLTFSSSVKSITDGLGREIAWTESYDQDNHRTFCNFTLAAGEFYTVTLDRGGFRDWPDEKELTIFAGSDAPVRIAQYQDRVRLVSGDTLTDRTDSTFESAARYSVGDVLLIDEADAITVTGAADGVYSYAPAGLDEVYRHLELSGFTGTETVTVELGETEAELEARFRESEIYKTYLQTLEQTVAELQLVKEYEGKIDEDTSFKATVTSDIRGRQAVLKAEITLNSTMKTKLPNKAEEEVNLETVFSVEVLEDLNYHFRTLNDDRAVQSYLLISDETVTTEVRITASLGEEDGSSSKEFDSYFADKVRSNFLEKLKKTPKGKPFELLKDARVSAMVYPGIFLYARPSVEVEWNFFGEVYLKGTMVEKARKGVSMIHLGDSYLGTWEDWDIRKFTDAAAQDRSFSASTGFHMAAFVYPALRLGVGVSVLKTLDLEVWAKSGVKLAFDGHGDITFATKKPVDVEAELLVDVTLESRAGVGGFLNLGKKRLTLEDAQFQLWEKSIPIRQFGFGLMPTEFAVVEEEPVLVSSKCDLKQLIDLRLDCQNFKSVNGIAEEAKVLDRDRYTFILLSGNATLTTDGQLQVLNTGYEQEFEVKVTYTGFAKNYRLWKIVKLKYIPANITLTKNTPTGPATCVVRVLDVTSKPISYRDVTVPGQIVIEAINGHTYHIIEITPPPKHTLDKGVRTVSFGTPENPSPHPEGHAGFYNVPYEDPTPPKPMPIDPIADPSGFVFEGIRSNRLSGVTTTLYRADDAAGTNARLWDAAPYDQRNPLTTDLEGKYLWMVPNGWWQVRYTLDGYEDAQSEWMIVPPVRTEVNQNLVSPLPAGVSLHFSEDSGCPILTFSRPVRISSLLDLTITLDGMEVWAEPDPVDADWSVTADPLDSVLCATTFRLWLDRSTDLRERTVVFTAKNVMTYYGTTMAELTASLTIPPQPSHRVTVTGGSGSGIYSPGQEVTIQAEPGLCQVFESWSSGNTVLYDPWSSTTAFRMPDAEVTIRANYRWEHSYQSQVTEPTCLEPGFTTHTCTLCGDSFTDAYTALGDHAFGDWLLTIAPTYLETGMETRTCAVCGEQEHRLTEPMGNPFTDVPAGSFYDTPVLWAVEKGITNGATATTFNPGGQCQRAQVVTFLWRAAGSPEPVSTNNPFRDVKPSDFYYKAVLWAVEKGITNGLTADTFGPFALCNRAQVVTFLWRAMGQPDSDAAVTFTDVQPGLFYSTAVAWAVEKGITNGISATEFGVGGICNRAQVVTFLYRAYN